MKIDYVISRDLANKDFVKVCFSFLANTDKHTLQLPYWRPGRYERADFHKRVRNFSASGSKGQISCHRSTDNTWDLNDLEPKTSVNVEYLFYAKKLDAGSTWTDDDLLYVNPVNCCMYPLGLESAACNLKVDVPDHWEIACGLPLEGKTLKAENFDRLADSPFLASADLKHIEWNQEGIDIHLWFSGFFDLDEARLQKEFSAFFKVQLDMFGSFPVNDYHFLFIFPEHKGYHGVEHINSTVIFLGPSVDVKGPLYNDFLGVSSHELFHTWNVKNFRPKSMTPYDFTKENYSDLGYVYEGITTYYGDLILARAGVFNKDEYFHELNVYLERHALNYARFSISVAESSRTTWVDGYENFTPWRKTSIYVEGAMNALLLDIKLRKQGSNLDELMRRLYERQKKNPVGYDRAVLIEMLSELLNEDCTSHFEKYYESPADFIPVLDKELSLFGCQLKEVPNKDGLKKRFGMILNETLRITAIAPDSPASKAGLCLGDEILVANGWRAQRNSLNDHLGPETSVLYVAAQNGKAKEVSIWPEKNKAFFSSWVIVQDDSANSEQKKHFQSWCGLPFE